MNVIHLISGGDTGGAKTHVLSLLAGLNQEITADLVCFMEGPFSREAVSMGIPVTVLENSFAVSMNKVKHRIEQGSYIAKSTDVTSLLGTDDLAKKMNQFVSFKGLKIEASKIEGEDQERAFLYKWNGAGEQGDDLYFKASVNGQTYTFVIESYLCGKDTAVYKAVEALKVGDTVDLEGFLYWYEGPQPHITSVTVK